MTLSRRNALKLGLGTGASALLPVLVLPRKAGVVNTSDASKAALAVR